MKCAVNRVVHEGVEGNFRGNADQIGWQSLDGERARVLEAASVRRVEWFEGKLKVLSESDGTTEVLSLENFAPEDYDTLWRYFNQACNVYIKKHTRVAALAEADFDLAAHSVEEAADRVDAAPAGSVQKKSKEADLMKKVESVRDGLELAVSGDKQALSRVFAANQCERIGRLRLVVDTVQLEVYHTDPRWKDLISRAATIEAVLKELGTFRTWKPPEDSSLVRRQMVRELKRRHGDEDEADDDQAPKVPSGLQAERMAALGPLGQLPLGGFQPQQEQQPPPPEPALVAADPLATSSTYRVEEEIPEAKEDEEVSDPNAVRADALDIYARRRLNASALGDTEDRRMRKTHPGSVLEGWVWKRSRFLKRWRRRWLVLTPSALLSFKMKGDREATEIIEKGTVMRVYAAEHEIAASKCFCVSVAKRNFYMVCDEEEMKQAWIRETTKAL